MPALQGLSGLYPDPQATGDYMDEGVLEAKANTPDPEHGQYGSQSLGYSGIDPTENPYGPFASYDGWAYNADYSGMEYNVYGSADDKTPDKHIAPWPRGIQQPSYDDPDAYVLVGEQLQALHGENMGGVYFQIYNSPGGHEEQTDYTTDRYDAPNESYLAREQAGQLKAGSGYGGGRAGVGNAGGSNADPDQGYGVVNSIPEFAMGHSIRRVQHDRMPWDFTLLKGEQDVPFPARHPVQQMPLDGPDSPYYAMGSIDGANVPWEGRISDPTAYQQPAEVTVAPAPSASSSSDVFAWG
jgi:hypothetical protein